MADFTPKKKYNYLWESSKFKDVAFSGGEISQFLNDVGYITSDKTGSLLFTASFLDPDMIFERGDKTSFNVNISSLTVTNAATASYIDGGTF